MARNSEFYKGRRKKRSYAIIPAAVIIGLLVLTVVLFYSMQQYAVISKDGVSVELPLLESEEKTTVDSEGNVVKVFDPVDASITFDDPDYSGVEAQVGEDVPAMRAIYVSSENITQDKLNEYADRLSVGNALVLEMKPVSGNLMWNSQAQAAVNYGLYVETDQTRQIPELIGGLKAREDKDIYLVAEINVAVMRCTRPAARPYACAPSSAATTPTTRARGSTRIIPSFGSTSSICATSFTTWALTRSCSQTSCTRR